MTWQRYKPLVEQKHISVQEYDEKQAALTAAEARWRPRTPTSSPPRRTSQRLTETRSFQKVFAPFSGVISGRAYDVGSLIVANPSNVDVKPLYKIAQNDVLRAFVNVPQSTALSIKKGMECTVTPATPRAERSRAW